MVKSREDMLTSMEEAAQERGWTVRTLQRHVAMNPPPAHWRVGGRWCVPKEDFWAWILDCREKQVLREAHRHPENRRFRPEEPIEIADIRARQAATTPKSPRHENDTEDT